MLADAATKLSLKTESLAIKTQVLRPAEAFHYLQSELATKLLAEDDNLLVTFAEISFAPAPEIDSDADEQHNKAAIISQKSSSTNQ